MQSRAIAPRPVTPLPRRHADQHGFRLVIERVRRDDVRGTSLCARPRRATDSARPQPVSCNPGGRACDRSSSSVRCEMFEFTREPRNGNASRLDSLRRP